MKCDGTRAETRFRLSAKRTSSFKSVGASVQSAGSRGVRISGSNAGYTMFRGSVKGTGYPLHSLVSPSLLLPRVTVCCHISTGLYSICHGNGGLAPVIPNLGTLWRIVVSPRPRPFYTWRKDAPCIRSKGDWAAGRAVGGRCGRDGVGFLPRG